MYDVTDPGRPSLLGFIRGGVGERELGTGGVGVVVCLPAGRYGYEPLPTAAGVPG